MKPKYFVLACAILSLITIISLEKPQKKIVLDMTGKDPRQQAPLVSISGPTTAPLITISASDKSIKEYRVQSFSIGNQEFGAKSFATKFEGDSLTWTLKANSPLNSYAWKMECETRWSDDLYAVYTYEGKAIVADGQESNQSVQ